MKNFKLILLLIVAFATNTLAQDIVDIESESESKDKSVSGVLNDLYDGIDSNCGRLRVGFLSYLQGEVADSSENYYPSKIGFPNSVKNEFQVFPDTDYPFIFVSTIPAGDDKDKAIAQQNELAKLIMETYISYNQSSYKIVVIEKESTKGSAPFYKYKLKNGPSEFENVRIFLKLGDTRGTQTYKYKIEMGLFKDNTPAYIAENVAPMKAIGAVVTQIMDDAKNDFKKHTGKASTKNKYDAQMYQYALTLGGAESVTKHGAPEVSLYQFKAKFAGEKQEKQAHFIKIFLENEVIRLQKDERYEIRKHNGVVSVTDSVSKIMLFSYILTDNKLTELNIQSAGNEQISRNKKEKKEQAGSAFKTRTGTIEMFIALNSLNYRVGNGTDKIEFSLYNVPAFGENIGFTSKIGNNKTQFLISENGLKNGKKYMPFVAIPDSTLLKNECTVVISVVNFEELKSKKETQMDFGNGLETFKFLGDTKTNIKSVGYSDKREIIISNADKTLLIAFFDDEYLPLITKIRTPSQLLELYDIGMRSLFDY
jgi:hypothetical protein